MNNEIKFDHFENINELLEHIDLWYEEEDIYYERWFGLNDLKKLKDYISDLQQINKNLTSSLNKKVEEGIELQIENDRLKKELNKHIKEGIEKDQVIERLNKGLEYAKRVEKDYKTKFDKAIKCIKSKFVEQGGFTSYEWNDLLRDLLNILQGSDKE